MRLTQKLALGWLEQRPGNKYIIYNILHTIFVIIL